MNIGKNDTAVVITDPQNDVLSEQGVGWGLVGESVKENKTVENLERILKAAKKTISRCSSPRTTTIPSTRRGNSAAPSRP